MTMENSGHEETSREADKSQPVTHAQVPNPSRRRFNRAGVGASAVVLTLASRSVLAATACKTASGWDSKNPSSKGDLAAVCNGLTYQGWMTTTPWPIPMTTRFARIFGDARPSLIAGPPIDAGTGAGTGGGTEGLKVSDATLQQVIFGRDTPILVKTLVAAFLNARGKYNTNPTEISVVKIFQEWQRAGVYEVTAGVVWQEARIIEYLNSTQG